jgi:transposase
LTDTVLRSLSAEFDALYAKSGRPSIAPEYILRALLLQVFFSVRSERLLVEQIDYNLLFRWFVGLGMDDAVWNHAVFSKNRDRLLNSEVAQHFFAEVNRQAKKFMSDEHFTVDGTLIQAWASQKSLVRVGTAPTSMGRSEPIRRISPQPIPMRAFTRRVMARSRS